MSKVVLSHSGKQHSYQVAKALKQEGVLDRFYTSSYVSPHWLQKLILQTGNQYWSRRFEPGLGGRDVIANWRFELKEIILRRLQGRSDKAQKAIYERDTAFDAFVSKRLKNHPSAKVFWGFQGSCSECLKAANALGMQSVCELATAHVVAAKQILGVEAKLQPQWADSIDNLIFPKAYEQRLEEEPHQAQMVIAASQFTTQTLLQVGVPQAKIKEIPLGAEVGHIPHQVDKPKGGKLRLLYAGSITQRKGISYLLKAIQSLPKEIELHLYGGIQGSGKAFKPYQHRVHYHGAVSQAELFSLYKHYDALVLPTLFEGFGLVIVEAMAAGLPVITTIHSMGPDIIKQGENGYIVPIRDSKAITEAIENIAQATEEDYFAMRHSARHAALNYSWKSYQKRIRQFVDQLNLID